VHTGDAATSTSAAICTSSIAARDVGKLNAARCSREIHREQAGSSSRISTRRWRFGHGANYVTAFINIDMAAVGDWRNGATSPMRATRNWRARPEVYDLSGRRSSGSTATSPPIRAMAGAQIRRFLILHKALDADDGELTRTNKVRRSFIGERYKPWSRRCTTVRRSARLKVDVTFEDGRKGTIEGDVAIRDLSPHPGRGRRAAQKGKLMLIRTRASRALMII